LELPSKKFEFWLFDSDIINWLNSFSNRSELLREIVTKFKSGELQDDTKEDLTKEKLRADIDYKKIMIQIKKKELQFSETFEKTPSLTAQRAIKIGVNTESYEPPEDKKIQKVIQNSWNKFVNTLRQNSKAEWILTCKLCNTGFILPTKEQAINRFKIHLAETHNERVLD